MESNKPIVVITGISGFVGSQVCKAFLEDGSFHVKGTVRDKNNKNRIAPIEKGLGELFNQLELVNADLLNSESLDKAIEGCDFVVHTASPFPVESPKNEDELIKPAVEGTMAVIRAVHKHKVKRVVVTSSIASIMFGYGSNMKEVYDENDWSNVPGCKAYPKSKTLAEKAAWDYLNSLPEEEKFELVTINPGLVFGPNLCNGDFSSGAIIKKILLGKYPGYPKVLFGCVDVREVARAHLQAIKVPEAKNNRFVLNQKTHWFVDIAKILHENFGQHYKFKVKEFGYCPVKIASLFIGELRDILPLWGKVYEIDHTKSE